MEITTLIVILGICVGLTVRSYGDKKYVSGGVFLGTIIYFIGKMLTS